MDVPEDLCKVLTNWHNRLLEFMQLEDLAEVEFNAAKEVKLAGMMYPIRSDAFYKDIVAYAFIRRYQHIFDSSVGCMRDKDMFFGWNEDEKDFTDTRKYSNRIDFVSFSSPNTNNIIKRLEQRYGPPPKKPWSEP